MAYRINLPTQVSVLAVLTAATLNSLAFAAGGWTHFVQQQIDVNNPNSHGAGALLSPSQQKDLTTLDEDVSALEDELAQSINSAQITSEQASELRKLLGKIEARQTDIVSSGVLNYEDAESILTDEQRVKATLKAAQVGKQKPAATDFYDSKDAFEFRDHLIRKLYTNRINGDLSANEYDELRSHVEHAGQRLDREGKSGAHDGKLLKRMRALETDINTLVNGGRTAPSRPRLRHYEDGTPPQTIEAADPAVIAPAQMSAPLQPVSIPQSSAMSPSGTLSQPTNLSQPAGLPQSNALSQPSKQ